MGFLLCFLTLHLTHYWHFWRLDESEDESDGEDRENSFMHSYEDALRQELKPTTISRSFVRANEETSKTDEVIMASGLFPYRI